MVPEWFLSEFSRHRGDRLEQLSWLWTYPWGTGKNNTHLHINTYTYTNIHIYIYTYIYIYMPTSWTTGRFLPQNGLNQRDAHALNNGTRPVSHYKNSGFALFAEVAMSDAGWSAWLIDDAETSKISGTHFSDFGEIAFRGFAVLSLFLSIFFELRHREHYKNRGFREPVSEAILLLEAVFLDCTNSSLIGVELRPFICFENAQFWH